MKLFNSKYIEKPRQMMSCSRCWRITRRWVTYAAEPTCYRCVEKLLGKDWAEKYYPYLLQNNENKKRRF